MKEKSQTPTFLIEYASSSGVAVQKMLPLWNIPDGEWRLTDGLGMDVGATGSANSGHRAYQGPALLGAW